MTLEYALKKGKQFNCTTVNDAVSLAEDVMIDEHRQFWEFEELWQQTEAFKKNHDIQMKIDLAEREMTELVRKPDLHQI